MSRVLGIGLTWGVLWFAVFMCIGLVVNVVDPDSIDPGELQAAVKVLGPMGLCSGLAFAILLSIGRRSTALYDVSLVRAVLGGILGSALVQLALLNHGDAGLVSNIQVALVFCGIGGIISALWLTIMRRWADGGLVKGNRA
jgi:hypothetical protein